MKKIDFKKELREFYTAKTEPKIINVAKIKYITISGEGDPNTSKSYQDAIQTLYAAVYTLKFMIKKGETSLSSIDYNVMPLEGQWWADNHTSNKASNGKCMQDFVNLNKDKWKWKMMLMVPEFINDKLLDEAIDKLRRKKNLEALELLKLEEIEDGLSAQILYIGPYSDEGSTIKNLHDFITKKGYKLHGFHREIYLNDPRKSAPKKLKTIIRQPCK